VSQALIPEDLKPLYELSKTHRAWVRSAYDHVSEDGARISMWELPVLIERIASLEQKNRELEAQLAAATEGWRIAGEQLAALQWRRISEQDLPEIGQEVLACFKGQFQWVIFPAAMTRHEGIFAPGHAKPTHWMPKPVPPAGERQVSRIGQPAGPRSACDRE